MAKKEYMTLEDIEKILREFLVPREVASVLGCATYFINLMAKQKAEGIKSSELLQILLYSQQLIMYYM